MSNEIEARPQINVKIVLWEELSDEHKNEYISFPTHNKWDYDADPLKDNVIICKQQTNTELIFMIEQVLKDCSRSLFPIVRNIVDVNLIMHYSVENPIQVKKKIESILSLRCFW